MAKRARVEEIADLRTRLAAAEARAARMETALTECVAVLTGCDCDNGVVASSGANEGDYFKGVVLDNARAALMSYPSALVQKNATCSAERAEVGRLRKQMDDTKAESGIRAGVARLQAKLDAEPGLFVRPDFIWGLRIAIVELQSGPGAEVERDKPAVVKLYAELARLEGTK